MKIKKILFASLRALCLYCACFAKLLTEYSPNYSGYFWYSYQSANQYNVSGGGFWPSVLFQLDKLRQIFGGYSFEKSLIFIAFILFFALAAPKYIPKPSLGAKICALVFGLCLLCGSAFNDLGTLSVYFVSALNFVFFAVMLSGWYFLFSYLFEYVFVLFGKASASKSDKIPPTADFLLDRRPVIIPAAAVVISWIPMLAAQYPGGLNSDAAYQITQALGYYPVTNGNPPFHTFMMGIFIKLGAAVSGIEFGLFLYILFQSAVIALIFAYSLKTLKDLKVNYRFRLTLLIFYMALPMFSTYATTAVKDSLYSALMFLFFVLLVRLFSLTEESERFTVKKMIPIALTQLFIMLMRHNGSYVTVPADIALIITAFSGKISKGSAQKLLRTALAVLVILSSFAAVKITTDIIYPAAGVEDQINGGIVNLLITPIQQTAGYYKYYPDDMTEEEKADIEKIVDLESAAANYSADIVDPVANTSVNRNISSADAKAFLKAWLKLFLRHPLVYFDSFMVINRYVYCTNTANNIYYVFIHGEWLIVFERPGALKGYSSFVATLCENFKSLPGISLLENYAVWLWGYILLFAYKLRNKIKLNIPLAAAVFFCVVCALLSPALYIHSRYQLPYVWPAAFVIFSAFVPKEKNKTEAEGNAL